MTLYAMTMQAINIGHDHTGHNYTGRYYVGHTYNDRRLYELYATVEEQEPFSVCFGPNEL